MDQISYLPTKIRYNSKTSEIELFYRKPNNTQLFSAKFQHDHYIFVSSDSGKGDSDNLFYSLSTNTPMFKLYTSPKDAYNIYKNEEFEVAEADISPEQRFMCDAFYNKEFPMNIMPRIYFLDIEVYVLDNKLPRFDHNISEINAITIYDSYDKKFHCWFMIPDKLCSLPIEEVLTKIKEHSGFLGDLDIKLFKNPKLLLTSFIQFIKSTPPDIITAWNSSFDIPYICRKIYDHCGETGLRNLSPFYRISSKITYALENNQGLNLDSIIPGIDVIDMLSLYKKYQDTQKPSYTLNAIAEEELGEGKYTSEKENGNLASMYNNEFYDFCKYNIQDVRLLTLLEDKLKILNLACAIRNIAKINYQDVFHETVITDNLFIMEANRRRENGWMYALPSKNRYAVKVPYLGAYVKPTIKGRFKWVSDLDFKSLYPSIIKTFKLSTETIVAKIINNHQLIVLYLLAKTYNQNSVKYLIDNLLPRYTQRNYLITEALNINKTIDEFNFDNNYGLEYYTLYKGKGPESFNNPKDVIEWLQVNNYCLLPNGLIVDQNKNDAIIPKVVDDVMKSRDSYKSIMFKYIKEKNDEMATIYDRYQTAVKVINNSIYGVTANEASRLFNIDIAEGITTSGQIVIRSSTKIVNDHLNIEAKTNDIDYVLTNDTDSIIFTLQGIVDYPVTTTEVDTLKEIVGHAKKCQDIVNDYVLDICRNIFVAPSIDKTNNFLVIKNEWLANAGLFTARKMYVINMVFKEGVPYSKLKPTGIALRRSSTPKVFKPFLENVIKDILSFKPKEDIDNIIMEECKKLSNTYKIKDIAIPISIEDIDSYTKTTPIHVRGAKVWNKYFAKTEYEKLDTGKIKYIYVKRWNIQELNMNKEYVISLPSSGPIYDTIDNEIDIDVEQMKNRLIIKPIESFYTALNWQMSREVITGNKSIFNKISKNKNSSLKLI